MWRHWTAVFDGEARGQRRDTASATSCQWGALRFPRRREYHLSRYESMRATVSSWDQHGGGRRREDVVEGGGCGCAADGPGGMGSCWAEDDDAAMEKEGGR